MDRRRRDVRRIASPSGLKLLAVAASFLGFCTIFGYLDALPQDSPESRAIEARLPTTAVAFEIQVGLKDRQPTRWTGSVSISKGKLLGHSVLSGRCQARLEGGQLTFQGRTQQRIQRQKKRRKARKAKTQLVRVPIRLQVMVDAPPDAVVRLETSGGELEFPLSKVLYGGVVASGDGSVAVEGRFASQPLTGSPLEEDFPAAAVDGGGNVWVVYVAYKPGGPIQLPSDQIIPDDWSSLTPKGNGDQVLLARYDGEKWQGPWAVSAAGLDVWRPTVAVDGDGRVVVVWSQNFAGNWDLVSRIYDPSSGTWTKPRRFGGPGSDIHVVACTDSDGVVWLACQSWNGKNFDIVVSHQEGDGWSDPVPVGATPSNEWTPSIAAGAGGNIYVAFDTYEKGNYDVRLAIVPRGNPSAARLVPVADSPRFEARPSIAVDKSGRVWIAYEVGGVNWGKDQGQRWAGPSGVPFYLERRIAVRCWTGKEVLQTVAEVPALGLTQTRYPPGRRIRISLPRIAVAEDGRIWLLYRQHPNPNGSGEVWHSVATFYQGNRWANPVPVPNSRNLIDNRPAIVPIGGDRLLVVHSTDYRNSTASRRQDDLFATVLAPPNSDCAEPQLRRPARESAQVAVVHPNEPADVERIRRFRFKHNGKEYRLFRGEFHRHTELTAHRDQDGLFEAIFRYALDVAAMDWIGPGDHDNGAGKEYMWWLTQKQVDIYHHPPVFVPMFTYERSVRYPSGHRNVMFAKRGIRPLPRLTGGNRLMGTPEEGAPDIKRLYAYLKHFGGICSVHTSATNMGTDWRDNDPEVEPVVEIYQGHRQNYEHFGAPYSAKNAQDSIGGFQPAGYVWNALKKGYKLGFQVSSDHVSTHLSYGVVLVEEPTREGILEAFKKRRSYGAMDNIIGVLTCGEHLMGDVFDTEEKPTIQVIAIGTAPIARVSIIRGVGGETPTYVYEARPGRQKVELSWTDPDPAVGVESYYYVRIEQSDGRVAWLSPMWITYRPKD